MTILDVLKNLRDLGWLWSKEHPQLPEGKRLADGQVESRANRANRMGIPIDMVRGNMILASNSEMRRWCKNKSVIVFRKGEWPNNPIFLNPNDEVPENAECLQLFPKGRTITMPMLITSWEEVEEESE